MEPAPSRESITESLRRLAHYLLPNLQYERVINRLIILSLLTIAFAMQPALAFSQSKTKISLAGEIEENNGNFRLYLSNNSDREFHGRAVIGIGNDTDQKEIGQLSIKLPALEAQLLQFARATTSGSHYSLRIIDENNSPIFFNIAPIKTSTDSTPATVVTLSPIGTPASDGKVVAAAIPPDSPLSHTAKSGEGEVPGAEVTIKPRLVAGETETDSFKVLFELTALHPIREATMSITIGKHKDRKTVNINRDLAIDFKLPDDLDTERVGYLLTAKDGREIAKGEIQLDQLMAEDYVNVSDVRTDRPSYDYGETAKLTIVLDGKSPHGYRMEVSVHDSSGMVAFTDQRQCKRDKHDATQEFTIILPRSGDPPFTLEFKIYDAETGLLFDSGERDIPINKKDQSSRLN